MKSLILILITSCMVVSFNTCAFAKAKPSSLKTQKNIKPLTIKPEVKKGLKITPGPFRVQSVSFKLVPLNGKRHLAAAVIFNKNIDKITVKPNNNIRLLRKDAQHFWRDASTQNNIIRKGPNFVTWVCGLPIDNEVYVMHLRGTIKSADGISLDCNGDGKGEGGSLPAYESQLYQLTIPVHIVDELGNMGDRVND